MPVGATPAAGGGVDPNPGAEFDATKFETDLLKKVNDSINGAMKNQKTEFQKLLDAIKPAEVTPPADGVTPPADGVTPPGTPPALVKDANANAEFQKMKKDLGNLQKKYDDAEARAEKAEADRLESQRVNAITTAISNLPFRDDEGQSKKLFMKAIMGDIKRADDGSLIAEGDNGPLPYEQYIIQQFEASPGLAAASGRSGSGAAPGRRVQPSVIVNIDDIKPGMTKEKRAAVQEEIARAMQG